MNGRSKDSNSIGLADSRTTTAMGRLPQRKTRLHADKCEDN